MYRAHFAFTLKLKQSWRKHSPIWPFVPRFPASFDSYYTLSIVFEFHWFPFVRLRPSFSNSAVLSVKFLHCLFLHKFSTLPFANEVTNKLRFLACRQWCNSSKIIWSSSLICTASGADQMALKLFCNTFMTHHNRKSDVYCSTYSPHTTASDIIFNSQCKTYGTLTRAHRPVGVKWQRTKCMQQMENGDEIMTLNYDLMDTVRGEWWTDKKWHGTEWKQQRGIGTGAMTARGISRRLNVKN